MEASCYPQKLAASNQNEPAGGNELARRPAVNVIHQAVSGEGGGNWAPQEMAPPGSENQKDAAVVNEMARRPAVNSESRVYQIRKSRLLTMSWQVGQL